jgi:hypothetical protein
MSQKDELTTRKQKLLAEAETTYVDKTLEANFECAGGQRKAASFLQGRCKKIYFILKIKRTLKNLRFYAVREFFVLACLKVPHSADLISLDSPFKETIRIDWNGPEP